jgi:signal transduction histidine kinase
MASSEPFRVLFVDDDELALSLVKRTFADDDDIDLVVLQSANAALTNPDVRLDLIVSDQRMPEMSGLSLLARMAEVVPNAMRTLLTAYPDMSVAMEGINKGLLHRLVLKPWDPETMRKTLRVDLQRKREADRNRLMSERLRAWFDDSFHSERYAVANSIGRLMSSITPMLKHSAAELEEHRLSTLESVMTSSADAAKLRHDVLDRMNGMADVSEIVQRAADELATVARRLVRIPAPRATDERWDLNEVLRLAAELLSHRYPAESPKLSLAKLPLIDTPGSALLRVAVHLLTNAASATDPAHLSQVAVRTWPGTGQVQLEVANPGPRPPDDDASFTPFRGQDDAGLGLGLSVCRALVEGAGGTISIMGDANETRVLVVLPIRARPSSLPPSGP